MIRRGGGGRNKVPGGGAAGRTSMRAVGLGRGLGEFDDAELAAERIAALLRAGSAMRHNRPEKRR